MNSVTVFLSSVLSTSGWRGLASVVLFATVCLSVFQLRAAEPESAVVALNPTVNINAASASFIADSLNGIGLVKAQAIVDYRNVHGEFLHIDELQDVPGIGAVTFARIRHLLSLDDTSVNDKGVDALAKPSSETSLDSSSNVLPGMSSGSAVHAAQSRVSGT